MKKILEAILGLICILAIFLAGAENPDGSCNIVWTLSCIAVAALCGWSWGKMNPKPVHVTDEAYIELQRQIQYEIDAMEDEPCKTIEIEAELPDDAAIYLTIEMTAKVTKSKFTDDAWGAPKIFTETNWECTCEITNIQVLDGNGKERESDFDESNLDLEFEVTDWK